MYQLGDLIVYGATGVCRVEAILSSSELGGAADGRTYYRLAPLYQSGTVYTPADNEKVPMRPVISREEAEALIDSISSRSPEAVCADTSQALAQYYHGVLHRPDCGALIELTMSIYRKRVQAEEQNRRLGSVDERYMKQAERLLFGELAVALDIPCEDVPAYIARRVEQGAR
ncbi:MAG: CarD family transcriptional regulator [Oscillibacter sp.]|nr:CarD family transcriptional regulator [Oscillibacter sp.]